MCGSAATSRLTPQIIADVTRRPVACIDAFDVSALGAAAVARALVENDVGLSRLAAERASIGRTCVPDQDARRL